jgi:DNA-binding Lrp family transcriptional regulator
MYQDSFDWALRLENRENKYLSRDFRESQRRFEKEYRAWQSQIRERVKDAKAAGIHPLYAIGAVQGFSPSAMGTGSPTTTAAPTMDVVGNVRSDPVAALSRGSSYGERKRAAQEERARIAYEHRLQYERTKSAINVDNAQAEMYRSQAAKNRQEMMSSGAGRSMSDVEIQPDRPVAGSKKDKSVTAGIHPKGSRIYIGNDIYGNPMYTLGSSQSTSIEEDLGAKARDWEAKYRRWTQRRFESKWLPGNRYDPNK